MATVLKSFIVPQYGDAINSTTAYRVAELNVEVRSNSATDAFDIEDTGSYGAGATNVSGILGFTYQSNGRIATSTVTNTWSGTSVTLGGTHTPGEVANLGIKIFYA